MCSAHEENALSIRRRRLGCAREATAKVIVLLWCVHGTGSPMNGGIDPPQ
jgi:hypothetical protein